ncbi:hypothetical protein EBT25_00820 [bacterium]|nr:hypothetical protein [bacterium]
MGLLVPQLTLEPSGVQISNVYLGFGHQTISISKTFRNTDLNSPYQPVPKYRLSGYLFVKPSADQFDSELTYSVEAYTDDLSAGPYEILYSELKKKLDSTVDC